MRLVCPQCHAALDETAEAYSCAACTRTYPVVCGIPDFRLYPDPYIGLAEDREKGAKLWEQAQRLTFEQLLHHYYDITEEDPPDLASHWIPHSLAEPAIARSVLEAAGLMEAGAELLDIGCSTGGMVIAASRHAGRRATGVDVAFRWLVVGRRRLREAGVDARLICANAEALPFADACFDVITAQDALEHLNDPLRAVAEARRVSKPGAPALWTTNNRYAPLPEPHLHLFGVGYLPRAWQPRYVSLRRGDLHPYSIRMRSAPELKRLFRAAGYASPVLDPAPLFAPHWGAGLASRVLAAYNRWRSSRLLSWALRSIGPRFWITVRRQSQDAFNG
ncbi:MAG: methyltransferase domain-containing protein [Acidobacteria bacterium]|nr:methyltransferase domain-containing protein [Acidobacteriota bacterium]